MDKHNINLYGNYGKKISDNDVLLLIGAHADRCIRKQPTPNIVSDHRSEVADDDHQITGNCSLHNLPTPPKGMLSSFINLLMFTTTFFVVSSAQVAAQSLADSDLNNQSLYASGYISAGARTTVGGNVQSATAVTLAANAVVGGNIEAGSTTTLGADAGVVGYIEAGSTATLGAAAIVNGTIQAGTTVTIGASAVIDGALIAGTTITIDATVEVGGDILSGTTVTVGAGSIFHGNVDAGTTTTIGAGVQIDGTLTANSLLNPPAPPLVTDQEALITSMQLALKELGTGTELISTTFGVNNETLEAGTYSTLDYLTINSGKTLTLDGKGVDGTWIFNIANYLTFAIDAKVIL
ncbi:MAG: polymer-forming cytoskeletal protein [Sinobacterium sp.]